MTIDEQIEALARSLELLAAMHRDLEQQTAQRFAETLGFINQLARSKGGTGSLCAGNSQF
ncbi:MAG: hypothetical protein C5B51_16480 [Terriglobia bacterium]|nr:MAG: hypothetical protein C5B51_16480 [Terriglobia bacterium]